MEMNGNPSDIPIETLAETENYTIWAAAEPDGEQTYHLELGPVTAHFFTEEWKEFLKMIRETDDATDVIEESDDIEIELDWGSLYFSAEEWKEFRQLINLV